MYEQTWLSNQHPDTDEGVKCALLVALVKKIMKGRVHITSQWQAEAMYGTKATSVSTEEMYHSLKFVWFDVMSVPQACHAWECQTLQAMCMAINAAYPYCYSLFVATDCDRPTQ